ncbi:MAG: nucleotidyltransferase domain-containing protein [Candidatus Berkelbacteria bacterium]|nr:nucleotidyltransferase domain-containing protein [Candidatus Berkelbacteria bacterium]
MSDKELEQLRIKVIPLLTKHGVVSAAIFGSRAKNQARINSDYDFLLNFDPKKEYSLYDLVDIKNNLEKKLDSPVDVITESGLNPKMKTEVHKTMKIIYAKK